ncbi:adenylate/guanylate cyclase domain-containing protein [Gordonia jinhuaensis]|uniref:adenylate/guanylate cyclase domain-containing protein n=1 Tax=Gordonia jinhuaensis TaxID=1517702 RepID=UPI00166D9624|nr:adenylate/guanylate cyclase domain-containing protein [Gordonia jinhuaensis]
MRLWRRNTDYGSVLLGSADDSPLIRRIRVQVLISVSVITANAIGAAVAIVLAAIGIPEPAIPDSAWWVSYIVLPIYVGCAFVLGILIGTIRTIRRLRWAFRPGAPTTRQARQALIAPRSLMLMQAAFWVIATALFTTLYGVHDPIVIPKVLLVVGLSGVVVCAISYLMTEFALRPIAARAISAGYPLKRRARLRTRAFMSWLVGSGIPIAGMFLAAIFGAFRDQTSKLDIFIAVTVLSGIAALTGMLLTWLNSDGVVAPIRSVRWGMGRVRDGDDDVRVVVFDGSELGELQVGFNSMVQGLSERERLRDLFGRHVGREVAEAAVSGNFELGGAERRVAVVFVDVIGSTTLAAQRSPTEVVDVLNSFFEVIVTEVERHRGLVNKFEGDAVLAVFGAPIAIDDSSGQALRASAEISRRLRAEVPEISAGVGVSYGVVVAGNVGAVQRFEYTVIGDPVNEAARLSELAKRDPEVPLASGTAVDAASREVAVRWRPDGEIVLRGRTAPTVVCVPVETTNGSDEHESDRSEGEVAEDMSPTEAGYSA